MFELIVQSLTQIGGGPGPAENNLVRFGLPAFFWVVLFFVAWSRQRSEHPVRERLLVVGFALAALREISMFVHTADHIVRGPVESAHGNYNYIEPLEHALTVMAILLVSAAYMRFILDREALVRRYLLAGCAAVAFGLLISYATWPGLYAADQELHFRSTVGGWYMQLTLALFLIAAIAVLFRSKGWVRNAVVLALFLLLGSVIIALANSATDRAYGAILCPLGNNLYIWSVPLFGYVYFREQGLARKQAEASLAVYRGHLEQMVEQRTSQLTAAKKEVEQWADGLSFLHDAGLLLSASLGPDEMCQLIVAQGAALLNCDSACFLCTGKTDHTVEVFASFGMADSFASGIRLSLSENPALEDLVYGRKSLVMVDALSDQEQRASLVADQQSHIGALLGVPVRGPAQVTGLLFVFESSAARMWLPQEIKLLQSFAERAGAAWENALHHEQLERAAALEERQRIAADMHDGLAQTISLLALRNDQVAQMVEGQRLQPALIELTKMQDVISAAGQDLRRSIASLSQDPEAHGTLQEALNDLVHDEHREHGPHICLESSVDAPLQLPPSEFDQIMHIAREAVLNACQHAKADSVTMRLSATSTGYVLAIQDDGQGFTRDTTTSRPDNHFGVSIMCSRAKRMGGDLAINTAEGSGTEVVLTWPRPERPIATDRGNGQSQFGPPFSEQPEINGAKQWPN